MSMKTYYIYDIQDDTFLGTVEATSISEAELKASTSEEFYNRVARTEDITAFTIQI